MSFSMERTLSAARATFVILLLVSAVLPQDAVAQRRNKRKAEAPEAPAAVPVSLSVPVRPAGPLLGAAVTSFDFGRVEVGELVLHSFMVSNDGNQDLVITDVKPGCGCTVPEWPREPLKPGAKAEIKVRFNTAGKLGPQHKSVQVRYNGAEMPVILLLVGEVVSPKVPLRTAQD